MKHIQRRQFSFTKTSINVSLKIVSLQAYNTVIIKGVWKSGKPESGIGTGIGTGTGTGTGTGEGIGMGRKTYIKTGTTFTLIEVNLNLIPVQIYEC